MFNYLKFTTIICLLKITFGYSQTYHNISLFEDSLKNCKKVESKIKLLEKIIDISIQNQSHSDIQQKIDTLAFLYLRKKDTINYFRAKYYYPALYHANFALEIPIALKNYLSYLDALKNINKENENGYLLIDIGNLYTSIGLNESACKQYKEAEKLFIKQNQNSGLTTTYNNLALCYSRLKKDDIASLYADKALKISTTQVNDKFFVAYSYYNSARIYMGLKKHNKALSFLYPVLKLFNEKQKKSPFTESQDIELYQISSLLMAENYIELKQYDSCLKYIQLTEVFNSKYPLKYTTIFCNNIRARMLHRMNQDTEAAKIWEKTFNSSLINELDINYKSIISKSLMSVYDTLKNSSKANYYARTYYQIRDSMDNVLYNDRLIVLNNIILENENAQIINQKDNLLKQKQIDIIQVKQQRNLLWLSIVFILMILIFAIILIKLTTNKNNKINKYLKEVENLNRHNEFLISVLAHDLKGPLSSVISNLKDANENQDAEQKNRLIQLSRLASEDIYLLLEQLIHWIRLEKLSEKIKIEEVDLQELIGQQLQAFFNLGILNKKGFNVIYNTRFIKTNKYPLAIVVRNLILNAIKHCTNKKSICLSINYKDGMLEVEIENDFNNLNENFFSSFNSVSNFDNNLTENNSHKFGLVIIKKICKDMGWLIRVNKVNKSILKFVLRIPAEEYQAYKDLNPALTDFITHKLNETELSVLKPFIYKLKQQPIFETSKLVSIANEMPNMDSTEFKEWKFELLNAIYKMDKETFKKLLNE